MFNNQRYMTVGIQREIPLELQIFIWGLIDSLREKGNKLDYLQVFELTTIRAKQSQLQQQITHKQEQPPYKKNYLLALEEPVTAKIFVIDDKTHSTMLLANEY